VYCILPARGSGTELAVAVNMRRPVCQPLSRIRTALLRRRVFKLLLSGFMSNQSVDDPISWHTIHLARSLTTRLKFDSGKSCASGILALNTFPLRRATALMGSIPLLVSDHSSPLPLLQYGTIYNEQRVSFFFSIDAERPCPLKRPATP
jgi:hypothetical protein